MIFIDFETTGLPDKATYPVEVLSLTATKVDQDTTCDDCLPISFISIPKQFRKNKSSIY